MTNAKYYDFINSKLNIGSITLPGRLFLPAIAGYSDMPMRELCYEFGASLCYGEMVSIKGLVYDNYKTNILLKTGDKEPLKAVQLFGSDPKYFVKAITCARLKNFDLIDINLGCPVPKVVKNGEGSALMKKPDLVFDIVKECVYSAGKRPITVKMRAGYDFSSQNAPRVAELVEKAGGSAVIVHGRVREQYYGGEINYPIIREVKNSVGIPVIGNGNITDINSALRMIAETDCDGLAIARAAIGKPYIFSNLKGDSQNVDIHSLLDRHFRRLLEFLPERQAVNNFKKHFLGYVKGMNGVKGIKSNIISATTKDEMYHLIDSFQHNFPFKVGEI